ncbi:monosaccharide-transporting ATPase [Jeotgalibacillus malaysiensis]|uniref:Autoinducer 2 import ATP-binding protein LsrA n=1 Tax=Jeotgalibacillus malaysiensis TaxID=1508404 RepID=A0A0B5AVK6_9BACL|nr:sugar ABC transporter ATP-binding protein [Jeotgalibacillus malaysiensis]AJD92623.1 monosaccharide-transporting ATPase [Jeotgalibacillus malaysiensis]
MSYLQVQQLTKSFGPVNVLKQVDFSVEPGEVHALLGVNGAGKSTLVKILSGDYEKDGGTILIEGEEVHFTSPSDAQEKGIAIVVQEVDTGLIPNLSVAENVTLDLTVGGKNSRPISWKKRKLIAEERLAKVQTQIQLNRLVEDCTLSQKQMILLARAVASDAKIIIFDEPTAPLSDQETKQLFSVIEELKAQGIGMIYISHRMQEIKQIAERMTIMRDGKAVAVYETDSVSTEEVVKTMLGKQLHKADYHHRDFSEETVFEIDHIAVPETGKQISLSVRAGEIVGIAGLVGAGKSETANAIFGVTNAKGKWLINGKEVKVKSPRHAVQAGLSFIPEERRKSGVLIESNVQENLSLPALKHFTTAGFINRKKEHQSALQQIQELGIITSSPKALMKHLSGGNQQKVSIGKWLNHDSSVFMFDEPTKGIDVGAKNDVFRLITHLADQGKGILYFTSEFDELLQIADRILVMADGEITDEMLNQEATEARLMTAATGGNAVETAEYQQRLSAAGRS